MAVIKEINGKSTALLTNQVDEVNGTERVNIDEINGQVSPVPVTNFITDKLFLYYDFDDQLLTDTSGSNQVYDQYSAETGVLSQTGHDAKFSGGTSIVNQTINGATVKCTYQDGVNDRLYKSAYGTPEAGTGGNHGVNTFGIGPTTNTSGATNSNSFQDGFSMETWFKMTGASSDRPNLWSRFGNNSIRLRFNNIFPSTDNIIQVIHQTSFGSSTSVSTQTFTSGVFPPNIWYQLVLTITPTTGGNANSYDMRLYKNGQLVQTAGSRIISPSPFTNDQLFLGSFTQTSSATGAWKGYIGLARAYQKKLSNSEVLNNYIFDRSRFGI